MKVIGENFSHVIANISRLSGKKEDCGNYRPLTMLNIPSKITESVACETLDKHLENVIQENQWGYRKGLST